MKTVVGCQNLIVNSCCHVHLQYVCFICWLMIIGDTHRKYVASQRENLCATFIKWDTVRLLSGDVCCLHLQANVILGLDIPNFTEFLLVKKGKLSPAVVHQYVSSMNGFKACSTYVGSSLGLLRLFSHLAFGLPLKPVAQPTKWVARGTEVPLGGNS